MIEAAEGAVRIYPEKGRFEWRCPTCGSLYENQLGPEAVGGWDGNQRWVLTDGPTLAPSLGCRGLQDGSCTGHWFLRNGTLVAA